jgi:hypothetical protein
MTNDCCDSIQRCREEQQKAADYIDSNPKADLRGAVLGASDWFTEELLILGMR